MNRSVNGFFIEFIQIDAAGLIRIVGEEPAGQSHGTPQCGIASVHLDQVQIPFSQSFRLPRTEGSVRFSPTPAVARIAVDFLIPENFSKTAKSLRIVTDQGQELKFNIDLDFIQPHYRSLLTTSQVLHREHIYGFGPPNPSVHPEVLEIAGSLKAPILDFGCGGGALINRLRDRGVEAFGLEIESEMIRQCFNASDKRVTFYDGTFPSPYRSNQFRSVICSEVLEHIPNYRAAIQDIARIAQEKVIFTVPDASAIPIGYRHGVVPWHLLEGTHVNFFNQTSLEAALRPYFSRVEFGRIGYSSMNGTEYYVGISAFCFK